MSEAKTDFQKAVLILLAALIVFVTVAPCAQGISQRQMEGQANSDLCPFCMDVCFSCPCHQLVIPLLPANELPLQPATHLQHFSFNPPQNFVGRSSEHPPKFS